MVKKIRFLTIGITIIVTIILTIFNYTYGLGFLLGGLMSWVGFEMIVYVSENAPLQSFTKAFKKNRVFRYLIYILITFVAVYFRDIFNLLCFIIAISVNRIAIVILQFLGKGGDKSNDIDI